MEERKKGHWASPVEGRAVRSVERGANDTGLCRAGSRAACGAASAGLARLPRPPAPGPTGGVDGGEARLGVLVPIKPLAGVAHLAIDLHEQGERPTHHLAPALLLLVPLVPEGVDDFLGQRARRGLVGGNIELGVELHLGVVPMVELREAEQVGGEIVVTGAELDGGYLRSVGGIVGEVVFDEAEHALFHRRCLLHEARGELCGGFRGAGREELDACVEGGEGDDLEVVDVGLVELFGGESLPAGAGLGLFDHAADGGGGDGGLLNVEVYGDEGLGFDLEEAGADSVECFLGGSRVDIAILFRLSHGGCPSSRQGAVGGVSVVFGVRLVRAPAFRPIVHGTMANGIPGRGCAVFVVIS
jgi:hypothetical protein